MKTHRKVLHQMRSKLVDHLHCPYCNQYDVVYYSALFLNRHYDSHLTIYVFLSDLGLEPCLSSPDYLFKPIDQNARCQRASYDSL